MGRELRRKQAKKEGKSLQKEEVVEKNQFTSLLIIVCVLVIAGSLIYLLSALFVTKELDWFSKDDGISNVDTNANTVSNSILAKEIFKQSEEEYYVYFYDFNGEDKDMVVSGNIVNGIEDMKVYKVDTSSALNNKYVSTDTNRKAKNLEDLKVKSNTLIKISNDKIVEYYEDKEIDKEFGE